MKRVLITGSRDWKSISIIRFNLSKVYESFGDQVILISGHCASGADKMCEIVAKEYGWSIELYPADWKALGKAAGFIRNKAMVDKGADLCLAFILNGSRGASSTAKLAQEAGIKTVIFKETT